MQVPFSKRSTFRSNASGELLQRNIREQETATTGSLQRTWREHMDHQDVRAPHAEV